MAYSPAKHLARRLARLSSVDQSSVTGLVDDLAAKQATLVSGTNIKTVNGASVLGSGDLTVSGGEGGGASPIIGWVI